MPTSAELGFKTSSELGFDKPAKTIKGSEELGFKTSSELGFDTPTISAPEGRTGTDRQVFLAGIAKSTIPTIVKAIAGPENIKKLTQDNWLLKPFRDIPENIKPKGIMQNIYYGAGEYAPDIAALALSGGTSALGELTTSTALKAGGKELLNKAAQKLTVEELASEGATQLAKQAAKQNLVKGLGKTLAGNVIEGASTMGAIKAVKDPATQIVETGKYSPLEHAKNVVIEAATMGVLEGGMGLATRAAGYPLRLVARRLAESQAPVGKIARFWLESETEAGIKQAEMDFKKQLEKVRARKERVQGWQAGVDQELAELRTNKKQNLLNEAVDKATQRQQTTRLKQISKIGERRALQDWEYDAYKALDPESKKTVDIARSMIKKYPTNTDLIAQNQQLINDALNKAPIDKVNYVKSAINEELKLWGKERPSIIKKAQAINENITNQDLKDAASIIAKERGDYAYSRRIKNDWNGYNEANREARSLFSFSKGKGDVKEAVWQNADDIIERANAIARERGSNLSPTNPLLEVLTPKQLSRIDKQVAGSTKRLANKQVRLNKIISGLTAKEENISAKALETLTHLKTTGNEDAAKVLDLLNQKLIKDKTYKFSKDSLMIEEVDKVSKAAYKSIRDNIFNSKIDAAGLKALRTPQNRGAIKKAFGMTYVYDALEKSSGVKIGHIPDVVSMIENRIKNISGDALSIINKIHKDYGVDGERLTALVRGEAKPITQAEVNAVKETNTYFKYMWDIANENGLDTKFLEKYMMPIRVKRGLDVGNRNPLQAGGFEPLPVVGEAPFQKPRIDATPLPEALYEKDAYKLMNQYHEELGRALMDKTITPEYNKAIEQLTALGRESDAKYLYEKHRTFMGRDKAASRIKLESYIKNGMISDESVKMIITELEKVIKEPVSSKFIRVAKELMYKAWITSNPGTILKQSIQPEVMGIAELGSKWVREGRLQSVTKEGKELIKIAGKDIKTPNVNMLEKKIEMGLEGNAPKPSMLEKGLNITSGPGDMLFSGLEGHNRVVSYLGARAKMMKMGVNDSVMETLTSSQKRMVMEAMESGGKEAAADMFGKVMSNRINFIYSAIDKPEILQGAIGEWIPFTTWSRNVWMRLIEDASRGGSDTIIKRVATAFAISKGIELTTGYSLRGSNPFDPKQMAQAANLPVLPIVTGLFEDTGMKNKKQILLQATGSLGSVGAYGTKAYKAGLLNPILPKVGMKRVKTKEQGKVKPILRQFGQLEYVGKKRTR